MVTIITISMHSGYGSIGRGCMMNGLRYRTDGSHDVAGCVALLDGWHHRTDGSHDKSGWLNSRGCRMDCLMEQTIVAMYRPLDGSIVAA